MALYKATDDRCRRWKPPAAPRSAPIGKATDKSHGGFALRKHCAEQGRRRTGSGEQGLEYISLETYSEAPLGTPCQLSGGGTTTCS
jgi:hypothetical protein